MHRTPRGATRIGGKWVLFGHGGMETVSPYMGIFLEGLHLLGVFLESLQPYGCNFRGLTPIMSL